MAATPPISWQVLSQQIAELTSRMQRSDEQQQVLTTAQHTLTEQLHVHARQFSVQDKMLTDLGTQVEEVNARISVQDKRMDKQDLVLDRIEHKLDESQGKNELMTTAYTTMTLEFSKIGEQMRLGRWIISLLVSVPASAIIWDLVANLPHLFGR